MLLDLQVRSLPSTEEQVLGKELEPSNPALSFCPTWIMAGILDHPGPHGYEGKRHTRGCQEERGTAGSVDGGRIAV